MSFKGFLSTNNGSTFATNSLAFATKEEAQAHLDELTMRWLAPTHWEVRESDEPVSHAWLNGKAIELEGAASKSQLKRLKVQST